MLRCDNCPDSGPIGENCQRLALPHFELEELQEDLLDAIKMLYRIDEYLLKRNANEVCITSHIFHYFALKFSEKYKGYNIDPEYNRNGFGAKYYGQTDYAKPDLIIHKRGCNKNNLLYVEFKVRKQCHDAEDIKKISRFVSNEFGEENGRPVKPYRYKYGVSVILGLRNIRMLWYCNGCVDPLDERVFKVGTWELIE